MNRGRCAAPAQREEFAGSELRRAFEAAHTGPARLEPAEIRQQWIPGYRGEPLSVWIVRPDHTAGPAPTVMYFHGGGFVLGGFATHERLVRGLAAAARVGVVFVEYSRAPEAVFPRAIEECYAATRYLAAHGEEFGLDGARLAVAGDCAGGNLAAVVALLAKYRGGPPLRAQLLLAPMLDATLSMASHRAAPGHPPFTPEVAGTCWRAYAPDEAQRSHPMVSPALAAASLLRGLPSACVIVGEYDPLRREGEAYAAKLEEAGVPVTAAAYLGCAHDFPLRGTPAAHDAVQLAANFLSRSLAAAPPPGEPPRRNVPLKALAHLLTA
jgi:acetyl esterase